MLVSSETPHRSILGLIVISMLLLISNLTYCRSCNAVVIHDGAVAGWFLLLLGLSSTRMFVSWSLGFYLSYSIWVNCLCQNESLVDARGLKECMTLLLNYLVEQLYSITVHCRVQGNNAIPELPSRDTHSYLILILHIASKTANNRPVCQSNNHNCRWPNHAIKVCGGECRGFTHDEPFF